MVHEFELRSTPVAVVEGAGRGPAAWVFEEGESDE